MPGFLLPAVILPLSAGLNPALDAHTDYGYPYRFQLANSPTAAGTKTDTQPVDELALTGNGNRIGAFVDDYYFRVHIDPAALALGNLVSSQVRQVEVWNAHVSNQLLSSIAAVGATGLTLTEPVATPTTFRGLESRTYELSISLDGPPVINANYTFSFPVDTPVLTVTGSRVVPMPFRPNWARPVIERLEWRTDVLTARNGAEQRRKIRKHPRRSFEYELLAPAEERAWFEALLWGWQARIFALPVWTDKRRLGAALPASSTTINTATTGYDYHDGGLVALYRNPRTIEVLEVDTVGSGVLNLARPTENAWQAGDYVLPARLARLRAEQALRYPTAAVATALTQWEVQENTAIPAVDSAATYRGYRVLETRANWLEGVGATNLRDLATWSPPSARDDLWEDRIGQPLQRIDYQRVLADRDAIHAYRQWLHARAGRLVPIWVPTWREDLVLTATVPAQNSNLEVRNDGYTRLINGARGRRDLRIEHQDGTVWYRRITGATEIDTAREQLSIDTALGVTVNPGEVRISYLALCRLEADVSEIAWHSTAVAQIAQTLRTVLDDV